jgi:hypothetical protein
MSMETRLWLLAVACIVIALVAHFGGDYARKAAAARAERAPTWPRALVWLCLAGAIFLGAAGAEELAKQAPKQVTNDYYEQQLREQTMQDIGEHTPSISDIRRNGR